MAQGAARWPARIVIVGAGIGGLAAAVALHQRGLEVEVYERSARLEEVGAGIQVGPAGGGLPSWVTSLHPTMPTLAQGGNMAIEDDFVLARHLARQGDSITAALAAYVAERQPRTSRVTLQSRWQFANNRKIPPPPFLDRSWIFAFDATRDEPQRAPA
jgi:2-polyprenyl-6-methoxyphenol hydroxylase-like FAD-dependent oxidoreductase